MLTYRLFTALIFSNGRGASHHGVVLPYYLPAVNSFSVREKNSWFVVRILNG